jgi:hypothetical protein
MSGKSGVHDVPVWAPPLVPRLPLDECRWTLGGVHLLPTMDSATTSLWYANDVIVILGIASVFPSKINEFNLKQFWEIKWNVSTWCPVVWFSIPEKTERISLPHWLAPTCAHCSVSNNGRTGWNVDQTHTFGRLVIINEPLNLRKTKMGYFSSVISVDSSKWMLITRNGWSSYDGGRNSGGVGQQIVMRIRINTTHRRQLGRWRAVTKLWARHQISGSRSVFFQQE